MDKNKLDSRIRDAECIKRLTKRVWDLEQEKVKLVERLSEFEHQQLDTNGHLLEKLVELSSRVEELENKHPEETLEVCSNDDLELASRES